MPVPEDYPKIYSARSILYIYGSLVGAIVLLLFLFSCGSSSSTTDIAAPEPVSPPITVIDPPPLIQECITRDLAGTCRKNPPTMGALEVE